MNLQTQKLHLIEWIIRLHDKSIIDQMRKIMDQSSSDNQSNKSTSEYKLSYWQKKRIEESEKQIQRGEYYTNEEANKSIERWLKK